MSLILQDIVLNECRREKLKVRIITVTDGVGSCIIEGTIRGFDNFTIIIDIDSKTQVMFYKDNIISITLERPVLIDGYEKREG